MNKNQIIVGIISVLGLFILLLGAYKFTGAPTVNVYPEMQKVKADDHISWSPEKKNILVEYSDFQCPTCKNFHNIFKTFEASGSTDFEITEKVTLVYRHFPLYQIHANAMISSYAAEAAAKQGKFFQMVDLIYSQQEKWSNLPNSKDYFVGLAKQLKLDHKKFASDMDSADVKKKVNDDLAEGNKAGIRSTPTFFLNGKKLDNISVDQFKKLLKSV